jgi:hypothetical protein
MGRSDPEGRVQPCRAVSPPTHALLASGRGHRILKHGVTYIIYVRIGHALRRGRCAERDAGGQCTSTSRMEAPCFSVNPSRKSHLRCATPCAPHANVPTLQRPCMGAASCHAWPGLHLYFERLHVSVPHHCIHLDQQLNMCPSDKW